MREATIRDVAARAGVSVATVSRALTGSAPVAAATQARVQGAALALRYAPHAAARSLSLRRSGALGVVLPELHGGFFSELLRGVDAVAQRHRHHLLVSSSHADRDGIAAALRGMSGRVDGLLVVLPDADADALAEHLPPRLPVVLVGCELAAVDALAIDNAGGAHAAVRHLLALGHRAVAHLAGPERNADARARLRGYREALRSGGVRPHASLVAPGDFTEAGGWRAARALLGRPGRGAGPRPTAMFAANDAMAVGALAALREAGVAVPGGMAVVGFDDIPAARYVTPALTTVRVAADALGARAAELLLGGAAGGRGPPRRELLPTELVVRDSCGPPPAPAPPRAPRRGPRRRADLPHSQETRP